MVTTILGVEDAPDRLGHADAAITARHYVEEPLERPHQAERLEILTVKTTSKEREAPPTMKIDGASVQGKS